MKTVAAAVAITISLQGCATSTTVAISAKSLCDGPSAVWRQVNVRRGDTLTEATASEIEANNLAREGVGCKYQKPAKAGRATS